MNVDFECNVCKNTFSIYGEYVFKASNISCPCCGNVFSNVAWQAIKLKITELRAALNEVNSDMSKFSVNLVLTNDFNNN